MTNRQRFKNTVRLLNKHVPGWRSRITEPLTRTDMTSVWTCVFGRVHPGGYAATLAAIGRPSYNEVAEGPDDAAEWNIELGFTKITLWQRIKRWFS